MSRPACPECGDPVPPSRGTKPRRYCGRVCQRRAGKRAYWERIQAASAAAACGECGHALVCPRCRPSERVRHLRGQERGLLARLARRRTQDRRRHACRAELIRRTLRIVRAELWETDPDYAGPAA